MKFLSIAVIYVKTGQSFVQMLQNKVPEKFFQFMDQIAQRVNLATYSGYKGNMESGEFCFI